VHIYNGFWACFSFSFLFFPLSTCAPGPCGVLFLFIQKVSFMSRGILQLCLSTSTSHDCSQLSASQLFSSCLKLTFSFVPLHWVGVFLVFPLNFSLCYLSLSICKVVSGKKRIERIGGSCFLTISPFGSFIYLLSFSCFPFRGGV